jgi:hypothetical protein
LLPTLRSKLPPYVYVIFGLELQIETETYDKLNDSTPIQFELGIQSLNSDGSNSLGIIENLAPYGYKDVQKRMFAISLALPEQPYEMVATDDIVALLFGDTMVTESGEDILAEDSTIISTGSAASTVAQMKAGDLLKVPPTGSSTRTFGKLQLLDFT